MLAVAPRLQLRRFTLRQTECAPVRLIYKSISDAEYATVRANRAWLLVTPNAPGYAKSENADTVIPFINVRNIGKEPAFEARLFIRPGWITPFPHFTQNGVRIYDGRAMLFKTNDTCLYTGGQQALGAIWPEDTPLTADGESGEVAKGFSTGTDLYVIQACISYTTFQTVHYSRVCYVYIPGDIRDRKTWKWSACQGHGQQWAD